MKKTIAIALALGLTLVGAPAMAKQPDFICPPNSSGKIDVDGNKKTVDVIADEGFLIAGYCVKAGTERHDVILDEPVESLTISHPNGKDVSHYSLIFVYIDPPQPPAYERFEDRLVTDCEARFVATWRTTFVTEYVLIDGVWTLGEEQQVGVEEQVDWREATLEECPIDLPEPPVDPEGPVIEEPVTEEPVVEEPVTEPEPRPEVLTPPQAVEAEPVAERTLAHTGPAESALAGLIGLVLLVTGGIALGFARRPTN